MRFVADVLNRLAIVLSIAALVVIGLPAIAFGIYLIDYHWFMDVPTEREYRDVIEENVSPGASVDEILLFLDTEGFENVLGLEKYSFPRYDGLPINRGADIVVAYVDGENLSRLDIIFVLDEGPRFERVEFYEYGPQLFPGLP